MQWIEKNDLALLKSEKRKFDGHGKHELLAIEVLGNSELELDLSEVENPTAFVGKEVEGKEANYFVNFGD